MAREVGEEEGTIKHITKAYIGVQHIHTSRRDVLYCIAWIRGGLSFVPGWLAGQSPLTLVCGPFHFVEYFPFDVVLFYYNNVFIYFMCFCERCAHTYGG